MDINFPMKGKIYTLELVPRELKRLCLNFMQGWLDELQTLFLKSNPEAYDYQLQDEFCGGSYNGNDGITESITRSCKGVDMDAFDADTNLPDQEEEN